MRQLTKAWKAEMPRKTLLEEEKLEKVYVPKYRPFPEVKERIGELIEIESDCTRLLVMSVR